MSKPIAMRFILQFISIYLFFLQFASYCNAQKGIIYGKVFNGDELLQGATVSVGKITALTDSAGEFTFALLPGKYLLRITHSGYEETFREMKVEAGKDIGIQFNMRPSGVMDEVTVMGSRFSAQRSHLSTPVPVDVFFARQLIHTAQASLTQMLQFSVPSFNASRQLVNEPVTLRGLDPDQLLILVNGKRFHNTAFVNWGGVRGMLGRGAVSNDLNSIPFSAIEKIEILRDGASAQYGSDAIAGVINIQLKNSRDQASAYIHTGQFYKGDGETLNIGINQGFAFLKNGCINISAAFRFQNPTFRGGEYKGTVYSNNPVTDDSIIKARNFNRWNVSNAGSSKHTGFGWNMNGSIPLTQHTEIFWTTIIHDRKTVFTSGYIFPKTANRINPELFPDGIKPKPGNNSRDIAGILGIKGKTKGQWNWEYSSAYGNNRGTYDNKETNNASQFYTLGKSAPTSFYTGSLVYGQLTNNFQISKGFNRTARKSFNLGWGTEWRLEHFQIKEGEEASWKNYDPSGSKQAGSGGLVFSPGDAVKANRNVLATYIESESEFHNRFLISLAGRYEYYSDFGSNLAGKLATRYKFNEKFSVRSSFSNGYRAPSLQQNNFSFTRVAIANSGGVNVPVTLGIFRNNSNVATILGIPSLQAERSLNLSGGFTARIFRCFRLSADAYWIQIKNRIVLSGVFDRRFNRDADSLLRGLTDVNQVQFFTNAINTRTKGVDLVMNGNWKIKRANILIMLGANFNQTKLFGEINKAGNLKGDSVNANTLFAREERGKLEKGQPSDKIILSIHYKTEKFGMLIRNSRLGSTAILSNNTSLNADEKFSSKTLTDINIFYTLKQRICITVGVNNIFNIYPDRLKDYRNTGEGSLVYAQEASPFGFNGGYYFVSMEIKR
jgi:iron complex outermembrane receptor protein